MDTGGKCPECHNAIFFKRRFDERATGAGAAPGEGEPDALDRALEADLREPIWVAARTGTLAEFDAALDAYALGGRAAGPAGTPPSEREKAIEELLRDIMGAHADRDDTAYNQCDEAPCAWCESAAYVLRAARPPAGEPDGQEKS
jgi:hypothetical protein